VLATIPNIASELTVKYGFVGTILNDIIVKNEGKISIVISAA